MANDKIIITIALNDDFTKGLAKVARQVEAESSQVAASFDKVSPAVDSASSALKKVAAQESLARDEMEKLGVASEQVAAQTQKASEAFGRLPEAVQKSNDALRKAAEAEIASREELSKLRDIIDRAAVPSLTELAKRILALPEGMRQTVTSGHNMEETIKRLTAAETKFANEAARAARIAAQPTAWDTAKTTLRGFTQFVAGESGALGRTFKKLTGKIFNFRNALIGGLGAIVTRDLLKSYTEQESAVLRLGNAMKLTGDFTQGAMNDFQRFASELQSTTTLGDEATLKMLGIAKAMRLTNQQAKDLVEASADLAAATGRDVNMAFNQLLKTFGGFAGELGEIFPAMKSLTAEQLKAGKAVAMAREQFAGFAAAEAKTTAGSLKQIGNLWGDLKEKLGAFVATLLGSGLGEWVKTTLEVLNDELATTSKHFTSAGSSASTFSDLAVVALKNIGAAAAGAADAMRLLMRGFDVITEANVTDDVASLTHALTAVETALAQVTKGGVDTTAQLDLMLSPWTGLGRELLRGSQQMDLSRKQLEALRQKILEAQTATEAQVRASSRLRKEFESGKSAGQKWDEILADVEARMRQNAVASKAAAAAQQELGNQWVDGAGRLRILGNTLPEAVKNYERLKAASDEANESLAFMQRQSALSKKLSAESRVFLEEQKRRRDEWEQGWGGYFNRVADMAAEWSRAQEQAIEDVAGGVANIVGDSLDQVLRGEITTTKELGKALQEMFTDLARQILVDLVRVTTQMIVMKGIQTAMGFAEGGILRGGIEPFPRAAQGGVFTGPQPVILGDNPSRVEAAVPMPDGKRIPVDLRGADGMGGGTPVHISIHSMDGRSVQETLSRPESREAIVAAIIEAHRRNGRVSAALRGGR